MTVLYGYTAINADTYKDLAILGHPLTDQSSSSFQYDGSGSTETVQVLGGDFMYDGDEAISGTPRLVVGLTDGNPTFEYRFYNTTIEDLVGLSAAKQLEKMFRFDDYIRGNTVQVLSDALRGYAGDDILDGSLGNDTMYGMTGNDTFIVGQRGDKAVEYAGQGTDSVIASVSFTLGHAIENLTLVGSHAINGTGNSLYNTLNGNNAANVLTGGGGNDTMYGAGGNDVLKGGTGADFMSGGKGNDTYVVDNRHDKVVEGNASGTDTVLSSVSYVLGTNVEKLTLTGSANLSGTGNAANNTITGNGGDNVIEGGLGHDIFKGGGGDDTFVFKTTLNETTVGYIADFSHGHDTIQLENSVFSGLKTGELGEATFKDITSSTTTIDADDRILYNKHTGYVYYDSDGSGAAKAVRFAVIENHTTLTHDDIFVV